jgi:uncharacterized protein (TIGR00661 family)
MSTICYGIAGEGRGHATRARAVIDILKKRHTIIIYTSGQALSLLEPLSKNENVTIREIPVPRFQYNEKNSRLDYIKTSLHGLRYLKGLPGLIKDLSEQFRLEKPDLVISDFEPATPRAARRSGVPLLYFNHQSFLTAYDLSSLPLKLRIQASLMSPFVKAFCPGNREKIVSSFYFPPLKRNASRVTQIGVILGKEVMNARITNGKHLVVYLRKFSSKVLLNALHDLGIPVKIYGLGEYSPYGQIEFRKVSIEHFIEDLSSSMALITTAGNQVVGEALYLGKPVLAIPEPGNFEQEINGHFVNYSMTGLSVPMDDINSSLVSSFMEKLPQYKKNIEREKLSGNDTALAIIQKQLSDSAGESKITVAGTTQQEGMSEFPG